MIIAANSESTMQTRDQPIINQEQPDKNALHVAPPLSFSMNVGQENKITSEGKALHKE